MNHKVIFPFTAIVGQERMMRALILNAVDPRIGGVLIRGERGTAKSTAARALAALPAAIEVVTDCRFNCDPPAKPTTWCTECQERFVGGEDPLPHESKPPPLRQPARFRHRRPRRRHARYRTRHPERRAPF